MQHENKVSHDHRNMRQENKEAWRDYKQTPNDYKEMNTQKNKTLQGAAKK